MGWELGYLTGNVIQHSQVGLGGGSVYKMLATQHEDLSLYP